MGNNSQDERAVLFTVCLPVGSHTDVLCALSLSACVCTGARLLMAPQWDSSGALFIILLLYCVCIIHNVKEQDIAANSIRRSDGSLVQRRRYRFIIFHHIQSSCK